LFTSTSKKLSVAKGFGTKLFEIYLTKENQPATQINIIGKFKIYEEEEVLLLPSFQFIVLKKEKNKITIVEVPYQNQLETRMMSYSRIIWIDLDVNNDENKKY